MSHELFYQFQLEIDPGSMSFRLDNSLQLCFHLLSVTCYSDSECEAGDLGVSDSVEECCNSVDDGGLGALYYSDAEGCKKCPGNKLYTHYF